MIQVNYTQQMLGLFRSFTAIEMRVLSRWFNRTPMIEIVKRRDQFGGDFYQVKGGAQ